MRRATAIFLLMITAIFAIRPVIAMHYCMGELRSFNLYQHHETTALCPEHMAEHEAGYATNPEAEHDAGSACCHSNSHESIPPAHHTYTAPLDECCDNTLLELSTDDYQNKTVSSISRVIPGAAEDGLTLFTNLLKLPVPETIDLSPGENFPPGGLFLKDISILTYICIYRI